MSYVVLYADSNDIDLARKEYCNKIWQDNEPSGFDLSFSDGQNKIFGHITNLDQDQMDWLSTLDKKISYFELHEAQNEGEALDFLVNKMNSLNFKFEK